MGLRGPIAVADAWHACAAFEAILEHIVMFVCAVWLRLAPPRYSVVLKGDWMGASQGGWASVKQVAVKVYDKPSMTPKKQKMATREAIVLKYLNSQGYVQVQHQRQPMQLQQTQPAAGAAHCNH
jgi:hypothetical protein